ncbi:MAG: tetratricopeptide repeat protein [Chloroflexota bacterium]|nr:tetratricopeptide repeat protein [Chloroflexota bacterium]
MLGKLGGGGDLIPSALRWLRRRGGIDESDQGAPVDAVTGTVHVDAVVKTAPDGTATPGASLAPEFVGAADEAAVSLAPLEPLPTADDVPDLRALVEANKNDPKLRWQLGLALVAARKLNLALAHLEVAASQDPSLDQGELADVRELQRAERQVRRYPRDPELRLVLGRLYLALDQGDAALAELEEAARLRPDLAPAHTLLGFEYAYRGRIARAREHWGRAHDLDPADEMSKTGLEAIQDGRDPLRAIWQAAAASS